MRAHVHCLVHVVQCHRGVCVFFLGRCIDNEYSSDEILGCTVGILQAAKRTAGRVGARRTTGEEASSKRVAGSKKKVASTRGGETPLFSDLQRKSR